MDAIEDVLTRLEATQKKESEKLLSSDEARKLFSPEISKPTLIRWTADGLLNSHRIGGRVFYLQSEILAAVTKLKKYSH
ncbi:MAG TPA: helix-turn-helix domain-containing protein [Agriterribacter sp.]|nr:helix-turn-helix domain-containing protein [Agriterribacter sp.]